MLFMSCLCAYVLTISLIQNVLFITSIVPIILFILFFLKLHLFSTELSNATSVLELFLLSYQIDITGTSYHILLFALLLIYNTTYPILYFSLGFFSLLNCNLFEDKEQILFHSVPLVATIS